MTDLSKPNQRRIRLEAQLKRIGVSVAAVERRVLDSLFVDTWKEAAKLMDELRNELHVRNLRDTRGELEFLQKREAQLRLELQNIPEISEVPNG